MPGLPVEVLHLRQVVLMPPHLRSHGDMAFLLQNTMSGSSKTGREQLPGGDFEAFHGISWPKWRRKGMKTAAASSFRLLVSVSSPLRATPQWQQLWTPKASWNSVEPHSHAMASLPEASGACR